MAALADRVVEATLAAYEALPKHGKPSVRSNGVPEWTMIASFALTIPSDLPVSQASVESSTSPRIQIVSLGTGVKVLPAARLPPLGDTVHDCHAEVLARRGFVRWLIFEAARLTRNEAHQSVLRRQGDTFALVPGVKVWLYVSALPCGDASTIHTAAHQPAEMAEAFRLAPELTETGDGAVRGRAGYEKLGTIRTKPGRPDSPPSISFSCSDKIASWSVLGVQGALLSNTFAPIYLDHIVIGGVEDPPVAHEGWRDAIKAEAERALWGRLVGIPGGYGPDLSLTAGLYPPFSLHTPEVTLTSSVFSLSKPVVLASTRAADVATSNVSLSFVPDLGKPEVIINGCVNVASWKPPGMVLVKDKLRSRLCKLEILRAYLDLREAMGYPSSLNGETYFAMKHQAAGYQEVKAALRGTPGGVVPEWVRKLPHEFSATQGGLFAGWVVTGEQFENFTKDGCQPVEP